MNPKTNINGLELMEEAFHLLRRAGPGTVLAYFVGTLPFVVGLLYFLSDMSRSAFAHQHIEGAAILMTLLFFWMKTWQTVFCCNLLTGLSGEGPPPWTFRRWLRTGVQQAAVQPFGLFLLPLSLVFVGWTYAFFQNATVLGGDPELRTRDLARQAAAQARLWPFQNHLLLLVMKSFGFVVFLNLMTGIIVVPVLLKSLLGIETTFSRALHNPQAFVGVLFNTTFLATLFALTYLCLDPVMKALYVLRCFYGRSLRTGQDLKAELRLLRPALPMLLVLFLSLLSTLPASAQEFPHSTSTPQPAVTAPALDEAASEVLSRREYAWRMPRQEVPEDEKSGVLTAFFEGMFDAIKNVFRAMSDWMRQVIEWLTGLRGPPPSQPSAGGDPALLLRGLLLVLGAILVALLVWLLIRIWKHQRRERGKDLVAQPIQAVPNIEDESVHAGQLPEDGWLRLAQELLANGDLRLALRAFYLATLAHLAERNLITIARHKSNRDYARELDRRGHALPDLLGCFRQNVTIFDRVWYGLHQVNTEMVNRFSHNVERIRSVE